MIRVVTTYICFENHSRTKILIGTKILVKVLHRLVQ